MEEEEEDDEEGNATDDDYIGSDEESGLHTKDDPDDFVYQPGKKTPKKRTSIKRSRSRTTPKRKRGLFDEKKRKLFFQGCLLYLSRCFESIEARPKENKSDSQY